jgi:phosphotransferase system IIB component
MIVGIYLDRTRIKMSLEKEKKLIKQYYKQEVTDLFVKKSSQTRIIANGIATKISNKMKAGLSTKHDTCFGIRLEKRLVKFDERKSKSTVKTNVRIYHTLSFVSDFPKNNGVEYGFPLADENTKLGGTVKALADWVECKMHRGARMYYQTVFKNYKRLASIQTREQAERAAYAMLNAGYGKAIKNPAKDWYKVDLSTINFQSEINSLLNLIGE